MASSSNASGSSSQVSLDAILNEITRAHDDLKLNNFLKTYAKEMQDVFFANLLSSGQDPLSFLSVENNTLGCLYLLSARLVVPNAPATPLPFIKHFCKNFDPEKARLAPERITLLVKGIVSFYESAVSLEQCIPLLYDLLTRYSPSLHHLTTIHPTFVRVCVASRHFTAALPVLEVPITEIDTSLSDLHYNDNLVYHYAGGIALGALKRWAAAEEFFQIVIGSPAHVPAAIQLEAFKKLVLVQLILHGKLRDIPKYVSPTLVNALKRSAYGSFVNNYPLQLAQLETLVEKEANFFESDTNFGLIRQALDRARRWAIKKLTGTYITLSLSEIARMTSSDEETVRALLLNMMEDGEITGTIAGDGTVTFDDSVPSFNKVQVDQLLASAQQHDAALAELDNKIARSRDFISKAVKNKDREDWSQGNEEDIFTKSNEPWAEAAVF